MFDKQDCELFKRYVPSIAFDKAEDADKAHFRQIRNTLKSFVAQESKSSHWSILMQAGISSLSPNGKTPKEIWGCAFPASINNKSYALQLAFIVSSRGGELCFCFGAGKSQYGDLEERRRIESAFRLAKARLSETPKELIAYVQNRLKQKWNLRKRWRKEEKSDDFQTLQEWMQYASGADGNGASISIYYSPDELGKLGEKLYEVFDEAVATFAPLFAYVYDGGNMTEPAEQSAQAVNEASLQEEYPIETFASETGFSQEVLTSWTAELKRKRHVVIQGPPGTGKTYLAERLAKHLVSGSQGFSEVVQFHPSYTYEDFIQGLRPVVEAGTIIFKMVSGRFLEFCEKAQNSHAKGPCVLIIDEFNRASLSRVFGELMYLLEYRDREVKLASSGKPFRIPQNVYLIGTMNTADRSIALVDHALRRRFTFIHIPPQYEILKKMLADANLPADELVDTLKLVNQTIDDRHYEVGTSYFIKSPGTLKSSLPAIWKGEIEPYLEEYFYDQPDKFKRLQWDVLAKKELKEWA